MARHKKRQAYEDVPPSLDISSLIDVCFLLLIYFLVTSTLTPKETDLQMQLPAKVQDSTKTPDINPMFIRVDANGTIFVGTGSAQQILDSDPQDRNVPLLSSQLNLYASAARGADSVPLVQLYVDGNAVQQRVIDVLNALARVEISSVTFTDLVDP
jgi:biopolymer transport protein ExbD